MAQAWLWLSTILELKHAEMTLFNIRSLSCEGLCAPNMRRLILCKLAMFTRLSLVVPAIYSAHAQANFQYTYVEAAYVIGELEFGSSEINPKGYELTAQFEASPNFVLGIKYTSLEGDDDVISAGGVSTLEYDGSGTEAYTFYHSPIGMQTDFLLGASIDMVDYEVTIQGGTPTAQKKDDAKLLFTGLRHKLNGLELQAQWSYNLDAEDNEDEWTYVLGIVSGEPTGLQLGFHLGRKAEGDLMSVSIRQSY